MAVVQLTIRGALYDLLNKTTQQVVLSGDAFLTGLGVGGGPIYPPEGGGGQPPGGGGGGGGGYYPEHPIYLPPEIWPKPGHPAHPIVLPPDKPVDPPTEPPTQPADPSWVWGWNRAQGWHPVYVPGPGQPGPK